MQIDELPEVIPPELYAQDLGSAEEQAAFAALQDAVPGNSDADTSPLATGASGMFVAPLLRATRSSRSYWPAEAFAAHCSAMVVTPSLRLSD